MSAWGCPHDQAGKCARVNHVRCVPGMKGCVLFGRFVWADESKNRPRKPDRDEQTKSASDAVDHPRGAAQND